MNDKVITNGKNIAPSPWKTKKQNKPKTRLFNAAKNELGRISKTISDIINLNLCKTTKVNHWKNTNDVKNMKNKQNCKLWENKNTDFWRW